VLAVDISATMLDIANEQARATGLSNVETRVMDAEALDLVPDSFDAAICRSGLMLMADPMAALAGIRRALKPGRRLAALVFCRAEQNPLQWLPTVIARRAMGMVPPTSGEPGMFALSEPGALEVVFRAGGFRDVEVRAIATPRQFPSVDDAVASLHNALPSVHALLARVDDAARARVWDEIERSLREFEGPEGFVAPTEMLIGVGTK
jgi:SAM-dependent methyltransferase